MLESKISQKQHEHNLEDLMRIKAPRVYHQEKGLLEQIGEYIYPVSEKFFIICEKKISDQIGSEIKKSLETAEIEWKKIVFEGVCTEELAMQYANECMEAECEAILGIGENNVLDLAKAAAHYADVPVLVVPTVASSNAPCSSIVGLFKNAHFDKRLRLGNCPDMVLVDSEMITAAPACYLAAGMADAIATYLENKILFQSELEGRIKKGTIPATVMAVSKESYNSIMAYGQKAFEDIQNHICSDEVEKIIEANIYLSGIGFENGGLAAAHSIAKGMTHLGKLDLLHGECVSIGILAQMIMSGEDSEEFQMMKKFLCSLKLPVCLSDLGVENLREIAETIAKPASSAYVSNPALPFSMRYEMIAGALLALEN